MSFSTQPTPKSVVLKEPSDWDEWFLIVKALARRGDIEVFVDLTTGVEPVEPPRPNPPLVSHISAAALTVTDLTDDEKLQYRLDREDYKEVLATYKEVKKALKELDHHILSTIDRQNLLLLEGQETVYRKILALKTRLAPTDRIRELEVSKRPPQGPKTRSMATRLGAYLFGSG